MDELLPRLDRLVFFRNLSEETRKAVAGAGSWFSLAGGRTLYEQDTPSENLYFVLSGRLIVARKGEDGPTILGYIGTGEPVGEMSLLLDENHTASVYALRDTELLAISHEDFDRLHDTHVDLAAELSRFILRRSRQTPIAHAKSSPKVFALIGTSPSIDIDGLATKLCRAVSATGLEVECMKEREEAPDNILFDNEEFNHDIIILSARVGDSSWYRFVLRHADRFLVFARRDAHPAKPFPLTPIANDRTSSARRFRLVDLVMIEEGSKSNSVREWCEAIDAQRIFSWHDQASVDLIARMVSGRSVGIVLSGGGARAYAHIGAVRAMREKGVHIDFTCGTSMGGIIAAGVALGWSDDEMDYRVKKAFVHSNPLSDLRFPVVSLTGGGVVEGRLKDHFGDVLIEEIQKPYFCVSTDLTKGVPYVHRFGLLREALRASISLPGILPPIVNDQRILVDGGLINNFPTDIMSSTHRGMNIGIDVARRSTIEPADYKNIPGFLGWVRRYGFKEAPPIVGILLRSATTRRESTMLYNPADIMITPAVQGVGLRSWGEYDLAVEEGYKATMKALDDAGDLKDFCDPT